MIKKLNIKFSIFIICAVTISGYLIVSLLIGNDKFNSIKLLLDNNSPNESRSFDVNPALFSKFFNRVSIPN